MLGTLAKAIIVRAVQKHTGVPRIGTIPASLLTTGAALILTRGRRPIGLALAAAGGLLLWQEIERERRLSLGSVPALPPPSGDASAAIRRR